MSAFNVAICGGIAVGKTTLGKALVSASNGWNFLEERPADVAFIKDFYEDKKRWAFHSRIGMLEYFSRRSAYLESGTNLVIQDRTLHELIVFAEAQRDLGTMQQKEFDLYFRIFSLLSENHPVPNLMIRCTCDSETAIKRVRERGRAFEAGISQKYIQMIDERYDHWQDRQESRVKFIEVATDLELDVQAILESIETVQRSS